MIVGAGLCLCVSTDAAPPPVTKCGAEPWGIAMDLAVCHPVSWYFVGGPAALGGSARKGRLAGPLQVWLGLVCFISGANGGDCWGMQDCFGNAVMGGLRRDLVSVLGALYRIVTAWLCGLRGVGCFAAAAFAVLLRLDCVGGWQFARA